jgi:hypothetical protein
MVDDEMFDPRLEETDIMYIGSIFLQGSPFP